MNRIHYLLRIITGCSLVLTLATCALEDPEQPEGNTRVDPVFLATAITAIAHDSVQVAAELSSVGNTHAQQFGWVWSEHAKPTVQDSLKEISGVPVSTAAFETGISGLTVGKLYYFRPFITNSWGIFYGEEDTVYMGIPILDEPIYVWDNSCNEVGAGYVCQSLVPPDSVGLVYSYGNSLPTLKKHDGLALGSAHNIGTNLYEYEAAFYLSQNGGLTIRGFAVNAYGVGYSPPTSFDGLPLLIVKFEINTDSVIFQGASVKFINNSPDVVKSEWSFGDGQFSEEISPVHTYNDTGLMQVQLKATIEGCAAPPKTMSIRVIPNPFDNYWAFIPSGSFQMGCTPGDTSCMDNEKPVHLVTLSDFTLGKTEITQRQYELVTGINPSAFPNICPDCPVHMVSWDQIYFDFLPKLTRKTGRAYRLPTEAEWEYAARGGQSYKYAGSDNPEDIACLTCLGALQPVAQKQSNGYGLYDMSGNVWEWCSDWYEEPYSSGPQVNPIGPLTDVSGLGHVVRGGAGESAADIRVSRRSFLIAPGFTTMSRYGFRIVQEKQ